MALEGIAPGALPGPQPESHFKQRLELDKTWKANGLGVVAFVQDRINGEVWQALARPSCP